MHFTLKFIALLTILSPCIFAGEQSGLMPETNIDTAHIGEPYIYHFNRSTDEPPLQIFGLPPGLSYTKQGKIQGTAYDEGTYRIALAYQEGKTTRISNKLLTVVRKNEVSKQFNFMNNLAIYPNPFIEQLAIRLTLPTACLSTIRILNQKGKHIRTLKNNEELNGSAFILWDGKDTREKEVEDSWYFLHITLVNEKGQTFTEIRKILKNKNKSVNDPFMW